jgi:DNA-binding MarR family transcriptional regulator
MNISWTSRTWPAERAVATSAAVVAEMLRAAHRIRGTLSSHFAQFGLTDARFAVLQIVRESLPRGCTQTELAERLGQSESSVSTLVDRMRAADLLYRLRSKADRRKCLLVLTDHARETLDKLEQCHNERMSELLACFTTTQLAELAHLLSILDDELTRRESQQTDPPTPASSAVIPHPSLASEAGEVPLRPAG